MLAVSAAAATGVVVAGVLVGPGALNCYQRGDFGQCMGETFLGAAPVVAEAESAPLAEEVAGAAVETADTTEPTADAVDEAVVAVEPEFTLVRVEPDGSAVIAGSAAPGREIQIFANDAVLGSEDSGSSGDFVHVTEAPLPAGGVELRLLDVASGTYATESVVVIVQDDRSSEPLVVASAPGAASEILQGNDPVAVVEEDFAEIADEVLVSEEPEIVDEPVAVAEVEPQTAETPVIDQVEQSEAIADVAEPVADVADAEVPAAVIAEPVEVAEETVAEIIDDQPELTAQVEDAVETEEVVIAQLEDVVAPAEEAPAAIVAFVPPTIDAVEIDGDRNFFAGSGTDDLAVRLYVENRSVGTSEVDDGRWLVEAINVLTRPSQRIRVDMIGDDGAVVGRAEVDFVVDLPEEAPGEEPVVVAEEAEPEAVEPVEQVQADPIETPVEVAEPQATEPGANGAEEPAVVTAVEEPAVPTMVGVTEGGRTTSGQVIIRRGDNLWTIARRVYGEGLRYTQIYEANVGQIRDPDLIYPGQVFSLPGSEMIIGED